MLDKILIQQLARQGGRVIRATFPRPDVLLRTSLAHVVRDEGVAGSKSCYSDQLFSHQNPSRGNDMGNETCLHPVGY
jgi:hypothetical protein